jgi:hypothetical protein
MSARTTPPAVDLAERLLARAWDDDCDDRSRELLEEAAGELRRLAVLTAPTTSMCATGSDDE